MPVKAAASKSRGSFWGRFSASALALARTKPASSTSRPGNIVQDARPQGLFTPAAPPPAIKVPKLAMDDAAFQTLSWANQGIFGLSFAEGMAFMGYPELAILAQRAEYRSFADVISTEMTRKWIELKVATTDDEQQDDSDEDEDEQEEQDNLKGQDEEPDPDADEPAKNDDKEGRIKELEEELERLNVKELFRKAAEYDSYFGRHHLFVELETGFKDKTRAELVSSIGAGDTEISLAKMKKGELRSIKSVEAIWCYPNQYNSNDPLDDHWYKAETWKVMSWDVHHTRLLTFVGREVPDLLKPAYAFGGLSMTQMAKPYVDNWLRIRQAVSDLVFNFSTNILKTDLSILNQEQGDQSLFERLDFFNAVKNNRGVMALDMKEEDFINVAVPLGGLEQLQAAAQEHMAAVSRIPIVKLLGIQPAGLNASSEGEIRTFYDWIGAFQEKFFRPHLQTVIWFAMLNIWGEIDKDITFDFVPLWEMTPQQEAEIRKIDADTGQVLINGGVLDPAEERKRVASDPDTPYKGLDVDKVPEPKPEEMAGLEPGKGGEEGGGGEESGFPEAKPGTAKGAPMGKAA